MQRTDSPDGGEDAQSPSGQGQQDALRQRLPDQAPAACAQRRPQGKLLPPRDGARQQQIRDVDAGNQQQQAHRTHMSISADAPAPPARRAAAAGAATNLDWSGDTAAITRAQSRPSRLEIGRGSGPA